MKLEVMAEYFKDLLLVVSSLLVLIVQADVYQGRHVCSQQETISQPIPIRQSYRRAVFRKDLQRVTYQTAYRTVFRLQIRARVVPGCCPGWEKRDPSDTSCAQPVCQEKCENGGECVAPGLCMCSEGYTGYKCHIDIDECAGRNLCQQKCVNLPGSYKCECQEGFKLAADENTCDLCLSCTKEFQNMQAQIETVQETNKQDDMFQEIQKQIESLNEVKTQADKFQDIQKQLDDLNEVTVHDERFQAIQDELNSLKQMKSEVDTIHEMHEKLEVLEKQSNQTEKFHEMQLEIDTLKDLKTRIESIHELNETIRRLQEDDAKDKKIEELQKQVESLQKVRAQADGIPEMQKQIGKLQEMQSKVDTMQDVQKQLEHMAKKIQDLEADKAVLKNNLTNAVSKYEEALSAMAQNAATTQHPVTPESTLDPYEMDPKMPLDRLASLSEQISILEERMASCICQQDPYYRG